MQILRLIVLILIFYNLNSQLYAQIEYKILNSFYIYNGENAEYWEETRTTLTYIENILQPYCDITINSNIELKIGVGLFIPFNQESKIKDYYPYIQTKFMFGEYILILGSLDGNHNFPPPLLDPLMNITPQIRVLSKSQVPIYPDIYTKGLLSHGVYEYGLQYKWDNVAGIGEIYINWQLPDTPLHRERFDTGLIHTFYILYGAFHYWHNGGHENPHTIAITENYTGAVGIRTKDYSLLYLISYFLPDRDYNPDLNVYGGGLYAEYNLFHMDLLVIQAQTFLSEQYIFTNHQFISIEGDPFYRVPFYLGLNVYLNFPLDKFNTLKLGFVNGLFLPTIHSQFDWGMIRYDQMVKTDILFTF